MELIDLQVNRAAAEAKILIRDTANKAPKGRAVFELRRRRRGDWKISAVRTTIEEPGEADIRGADTDAGTGGERPDVAP